MATIMSELFSKKLLVERGF